MIASLLFYHAVAFRIAHHFPGCENARVDIVESLPYDMQGFVAFRSPNAISIIKIPRKELKNLLAHECGHVFDFTHDFLSNDTMFGHGPFISSYAKYSSIEDFAETYKEVVLEHTIPKDLQQKVRLMEKMMLQSRHTRSG